MDTMYVLTSIEKNNKILFDSLQSNHEVVLKTLNELQTFNQFDIVIQITYILGGIILTHMSLGFLTLIRALFSSKPVSVAHLLYGILGPLVMSHFLFYTVADISNWIPVLDQHHAFGFGLMIFFMNSLLFAISLVLYQNLSFLDFSKISIETDSEIYKKYIIENRRLFYFLLVLYCLSITIWSQFFCANSDGKVGIDEPSGITFLRIFLVVVFAFMTLTKFEKINDEKFNLWIHIPWFKRDKTTNGHIFLRRSDGVRHLLKSFKNEITYQIFYRRLELWTAVLVLVITIIIMAWISITY